MLGSFIAAPPNGEIEMVAPAFPVVATATQSEIVVTVRSVSAFAQVVRRDTFTQCVGHRSTFFRVVAAAMHQGELLHRGHARQVAVCLGDCIGDAVTQRTVYTSGYLWTFCHDSSIR